jgi:hypothetical protein
MIEYTILYQKISQKDKKEENPDIFPTDVLELEMHLKTMRTIHKECLTTWINQA